jgi:hypothetical protein
MNEFEALHYAGGDEIQLGDRVLFAGVYATVVAVSNGEHGAFAPGYEDRSGMERGIVICDDDGDVTTLADGDERLELVDRGTSG